MSVKQTKNKFKDTTIYGVFRNQDRPTVSADPEPGENANAIFDRDVTVSGSVITNTIKSTDGVNTLTINATIAIQDLLNSLNGFATFSWANATFYTQNYIKGNYATIASLASYALTSSLSSYLTTSSASSTYLTQTDASTNYLTKTNASSTYTTISSLSSYLTTATASSTYATISSLSSYLTTATASSTYLTQTDASTNYLTKTNASSTYATISSLSSYLTTATASSTYATISSLSSYLTTATASSTYATISSLSSYLTTATASSTYLTITDAQTQYISSTANIMNFKYFYNFKITIPAGTTNTYSYTFPNGTTYFDMQANYSTASAFTYLNKSNFVVFEPTIDQGTYNSTGSRPTIPQIYVNLSMTQSYTFPPPTNPGPAQYLFPQLTITLTTSSANNLGSLIVNVPIGYLNTSNVISLP
jgi:hypothetical protein